LKIETSKSQQEMAKAITEAKKLQPQIEATKEDGGSYISKDLDIREDIPGAALSPDDLLIYGYTYEDQGLHIRRTLAQSYYPMLPDTEKHDRSQVLLHYSGSKTKCLVMVDQLWLWILEGRP
jgi:hypothetical protein